MLINNEPGRTTRLASTEVLVIDLALSTIEVGPLTLWEIPEDYPSLSDHELILLRWEEICDGLPEKGAVEPTGWDIQGLIDSPDNLKLAHTEWTLRGKNRNVLGQTCSCNDLDMEVYWFEENLAEVFSTHAKILRVTSSSKRWWNKEVAEARKTWAKANENGESQLQTQLSLSKPGIFFIGWYEKPNENAGKIFFKAKKILKELKSRSKTGVGQHYNILSPGKINVQAIAFYGSELWWRGQKVHQEEIQKLVNRQGRAITGMYRSTPIGPLMSESGLIQ